MADIKKITSFANSPQAEGERLAYTVSTLSETGELLESNKRKDVIAVGEDIIAHITAIREFLLNRENGDTSTTTSDTTDTSTSETTETTSETTTENS